MLADRFAVLYISLVMHVSYLSLWKFLAGLTAILLAKLGSAKIMKRYPTSSRTIIGIYAISTLVVVLIFIYVL